jgi:hypothetical protein
MPPSYDNETWHLALIEAHRKMAFESRVLRGIFGRKSEEITGGCKNIR